MTTAFRPERIFLVTSLVLTVAAAVALYLLQATTLTIAVAPRDGTEPALMRAYAEALKTTHKGVRLKILPFDDVRESARALEQGRADLAVVRPDVDLPANGLTLAILRDQAMLIASPAPSGITTFPGLARKRLGIVAHRDADLWLLKSLMGYYGLGLQEGGAGPIAAGQVRLVPLAEEDLPQAFASKRIDAVVAVIAPAAPMALRLVGTVQAASRTRKVDFVGVEDGPAIIERLPRLQAVTVPAGLFGGSPKVPEEEVKTVGASYRLMARASMSRTVAADVTQHLFELRSRLSDATPAADYVAALAYETTAEATSARLPIHPGAIDYFEREQQGFIERYGDWVYLLAVLGGGFGSALAWLRQRLRRLRRERIDVVMDRLLEILAEARRADPAGLDALTGEVDSLAADVVRYTRERETDTRTMAAVMIAIETARSTIADCRRLHGEAVPPRQAAFRLSAAE
ncbi:TAXI family TRAP transporter solute-binding subunit [Methylobacterium platani]|uniref:C4-dicarboxylate ABC transporter substrate-binding protein n=2 Tax=Methylobacterium platani TaxID=427683 RepID=A0A179S6A0_9HYPH|nr:TAXI family TRAP transporter solute-binding subunit [Methylobacterium platani]KMO20054.1 C4-dicarboxylate ABC transporter substrate-binding protein [Methylobacterium platani JCM 14648]OAS22796.1 C4-dicarboxylate ABC transporter substrate-binding protein [Methylobacterium platani]